MPKTKKKRTEHIDSLSSEELRVALKTKLTLPELVALDKQIRQLVTTHAQECAVTAVECAYKRQFACTLRY